MPAAARSDINSTRTSERVFAALRANSPSMPASRFRYRSAFSKVKRADAWYRIWIGALYRRMMKWVFRLSIRDVDCDFRLFRRHIFETISLESRSGVICVEMAKKFERARFRMVEVPVSHYPRMHGRSEFFRVRHLVYTFRGLLKIWWNLVLSPRLPVWMSIAAKKS